MTIQRGNVANVLESLPSGKALKDIFIDNCTICCFINRYYIEKWF